MAFDLRTNNLSGVSVIDQPGGVNATAENFIDPYSYAEKYQPELIPQLHMANGLGKITGLVRLIGAEDTYASDQIQHAEQGRLHNVLKDVARSSNDFTSTEDSQVRVGDTIMVSDGTTEEQGTVTVVTSDTEFTATADDGTWTVGATVDILVDFTNSWGKGTESFTVARRWDPTIYKNYSHIVKEFYEINASDMVHKTWIMTPDGPRWFNFEMQRTSDLFDNKLEITHIFHKRKAAGTARGMNGLIPQVETRGNVANEYITTIDHLSNIARRAKQQGTCREFTVWADHQQMAYFREMMAGLNSYFSGGANYGLFNNSKDMALMLDFKSVLIDGVTFHITPWAILEDPTLMGNAKFLQTAPGALIIPAGNGYVMENGNTVSKSYFSVRYRADGAYSRKREVKLFGPNGTAQVKDAQSAHFLSETTNQVIGANNFFVVRRGVFYSA